MDPAALIVAASALITAVGGVILSRRGQADTQRQEAAAQRVNEQAQRLDETQQALDAYEHVNNMQRRELDRLHVSLDKHTAAAAKAHQDAVTYRSAITELVEVVRLLAGRMKDPGIAVEQTIEDVLDGLPEGGDDG